jgi:hypothetical protein
MSRKERDWLKVLIRVVKRELRLKEAAFLMSVSYRQCLRRLSRFKAEGDAGLIHRGRGRSNRRIDEEKKRAILKIYETRYAGFGPTLAAEKLWEREKLKVGAETLRRWLIRAGKWTKRRKRKCHRSWRPRREHFGEMVQMDGSKHEWFGEKKPSCFLMSMVDDATGVTMSLLSPEETTVAAMQLLWKWIERYGIPASLYTDRKTVYVPAEKVTERAKWTGESPFTQFGRACNQLGIKIIKAYSPQAKGRIERSNGLYQDRLVKELRLEGITDIAIANRYLAGGYQDKLNEKFAIKPAKNADFHRNAKGYVLSAILCTEEDRSLTADWIVRFENSFYQLKPQSRKPPTVSKVKVRRYLDGELHFCYRGKNLAYTKIEGRETRVKVPPQKTSQRAKSQWIPPEGHPWRRSYKTIPHHRG